MKTEDEEDLTGKLEENLVFRLQLLFICDATSQKPDPPHKTSKKLDYSSM